MLNQATQFVLKEKGEEVISERHQKDYHKPEEEVEKNGANNKDGASGSFTDINFEDI